MICRFVTFIKAIISKFYPKGDEFSMSATMLKPKPSVSQRSKKMEKICESVVANIPSELEINRMGRSVVMVKSGRVYPVTHSVLKPLTKAIVDTESEVKIKTNGLTIAQVDKIANVISANENATVEVTLPKYARGDEAIVGEIYIKGGK